MAFDICVVPSCQLNSIDSAKLFIKFPRKSAMKVKWLEAINYHRIFIDNPPHICEDHFDLEKDAANWQDILNGERKVILKPGVVPHRNIEQNLTNRYYTQASKGKLKLNPSIKKLEEGHNDYDDPDPSPIV